MPPNFGSEYASKVIKDERVRQYLPPQRIVWQSDKAGQSIIHPEVLLTKGNNQADLTQNNLCTLKSSSTAKPGILFDFGKELHGGLRLTTALMKVQRPVKVRIRFGESVSEAMSETDSTTGATNDHAMRDFVVELPWLGSLEVGNTGFRFVRIDLVEENRELLLKELKAIFTYRDIPYLGSFKTNDERLNKIWATGAYTVHLNMQEYLWDGIKRDRLVWVGDMHPEVMTINSVFGYSEVVPKSLDLARDITPLPEWMNGISTYSMWWVLIHRDWYMHQGNLAYLQQQKEYLVKLLNHLMSKTKGNQEALDGMRFMDWPSSENQPAVHAGLQAMMVMTLDAGAQLCQLLNEPETAKKCQATVARLRKYVPISNNSKQAAALLALANLVPAQKANKEVLAVDGCARMSTFYGYYMLQARAKAGDYQGALDCIRTYWGGMLDMGATTFWEDFDLSWMTNAAPIDGLVPTGKKDIHGDFGAYCYKQLRHSLSHGWASGPTPWLSEHVLGIQVIEPGCKAIKIAPHLGDLQWAEGTFPTPYGIVTVKHKKLSNGKIETTVDAPKEVRIIQ
ncbi:MAG: alpha-L-rhamnosidase C-terminal domain-containing protein [Bacteroidota bacterium]